MGQSPEEASPCEDPWVQAPRPSPGPRAGCERWREHLEGKPRCPAHCPSTAPPAPAGLAAHIWPALAGREGTGCRWPCTFGRVGRGWRRRKCPSFSPDFLPTHPCDRQVGISLSLTGNPTASSPGGGVSRLLLCGPGAARPPLPAPPSPSCILLSAFLLHLTVSSQTRLLS